MALTTENREPEQLSLFAPDGFTPVCSEKAQSKTSVTPAVPTAQPVTTTAKKKKENPKDKLKSILAEPGCKDFLEKITDAINRQDFRNLLSCINIQGFNIDRPYYEYYNGATCAYFHHCLSEKEYGITHLAPGHTNTYPNFHTTKTREYNHVLRNFTLNIGFTSTENAETILVPVKISLEAHNYNEISGTLHSMEMGKPFLPSSIQDNVFFSQTEGELSQIILKHKPWIAQWLSKNTGYQLNSYLAAPWLETLEKAGFKAIVKDFLSPDDYYGLNTKKMEQFNRLCGPGTKPKDIFKCTKAVYSVLKDESNLAVWDTFRKLEKKGAVTGDAFLQVYQMNLHPKDLDLMSSILGQKHNGRSVFTLTSLVNYINRLDMYEAIDSDQAFQILNDYLHMCHQLGMPPRIDGDSLKREHDIAARLCRERRNQIMEQKMKERAEKEKMEIEEGNKKLSRATYKENVFFIRPITEYNDLLDEAIQQDNCVASYADRIAKGQSRIFTLRETAHPGKSLVTIELSPDCKTIRQKYLAHNQVIRNKAINDFIDRWYKQLNAA